MCIFHEKVYQLYLFTNYERFSDPSFQNTNFLPNNAYDLLSSMNTPHFRIHCSSPVSVQHKNFSMTQHLVDDTPKLNSREEAKCEGSFRGSPSLRDQLDEKSNIMSNNQDESNIHISKNASMKNEDHLSRLSPNSMRKDSIKKNLKADVISSPSFVEW